MEAKKLHEMTINEFNQMATDDQMVYELINGLVMMSPRPSIFHQTVMSELHLEIGIFLRGKSCNVLTETEVELDDNVVVPDLFVYCDPDKLTKQRYIGAPKLVIEILSPSTAFNDLNIKLKLYEAFGVEAYWVVAPSSKSITVYHFESQTARVYNTGEQLTSKVLEGLIIDLDSIFSNP